LRASVRRAFLFERHVLAFAEIVIIFSDRGLGLAQRQRAGDYK
jgi:hypothetical protein